MIAAIIQNRAAAAPLMKKLRSRDESIHPVAMPAAASPATPKKAPPATTKRMDRSRRMTIYDLRFYASRFTVSKSPSLQSRLSANHSDLPQSELENKFPPAT